MAMTTLSRQIRADTKRGSGGKGGRGMFYEKLTLPKDVPTAILVIDAQYIDPNPQADVVEIDQQTGRPLPVMKPYYKARIHRRVLNPKTPQARYFTSNCSSGWNAHNPQPCAGCAAMDRGDTSVSAPDVAAFTVLHLATYHKHPMIDKKTGEQVVKREQGGGYVMVDSECTGRTCNFCRTLNGQQLVPDPKWPGFLAKDIQTFFGKRRYLELGRGHLEGLGRVEQEVASKCGNDGTLFNTEGFRCPHCNSLVIDRNQDIRDDKELAEAVSKPYPCLQCQRPVLLQEAVYCQTCDEQNPPRTCKQLSWVDRVLWLCREGEDMKSQIVLKQHQSLAEFSARVPAAVLNGKTVGDIIGELAQPYEFDKIYAPKSYEEQEIELGFRERNAQQNPHLGQGNYQGHPQNVHTGSGYGQGGYGQPQQPGPQAPPPMQRPNFGN